MKTGFCLSYSPDGVYLELFGNRQNDSGLLHYYSYGKVTAVMMGRIYYQNDLVSLLPKQILKNYSLVFRTNPAALVLATFDAWGKDGLIRCEGDYSIAIWDGNTQEFIGIRDPLGGYPLFWTQQKNRFSLSTCLRQFVPDPVNSINLEYLARYVMDPSIATQQLSYRDTAFRGIQRVNAGTLLLANILLQQTREIPYWNWAEQINDPGTGRMDELAPTFRSLLSEAVNERLVPHKTVATHFSGGMDSTSVGLLAQDGVKLGRSAGPVRAIALVYKSFINLSHESTYIDCAEQESGIAIERLNADELYIFDGFNDPPIHDEPWANLSFMSTERAMIDAAERSGAETILTGVGGDHILDIPPCHIADLLRKGNIFSAWKEASQLAEIFNCGVWTMLYQFGIEYVLPIRFRQWEGSLTSMSEYCIPPWILPSFANEYNLRDRGIENLRRVSSFHSSTALSVALSTIANRNGDVNRWYLAAPKNIHIAHPFLDPRMIGFTLGCSIHMTDCFGSHKPLLAEAMRDILPEKIRQRKDKGNFNEAYMFGLSHNVGRLERMIREAPLDEIGLINRKILIQYLHRAALGAIQSSKSLGRFQKTLSLVKWLSQLHYWNSNRLIPTQIIPIDKYNNPSSG